MIPSITFGTTQASLAATVTNLVNHTVFTIASIPSCTSMDDETLVSIGWILMGYTVTFAMFHHKPARDGAIDNDDFGNPNYRDMFFWNLHPIAS